MADKHTSGDGRNNLSESLLDCKVYAASGSTKKESEDRNLWPRALAQKWTVMLFLGSCLLYCARMAMPICAVSMAASFHWSKIDTGLVLGGFFWGYCFTQILGGHASDKVGGERVLLISAVSWALITAATPLLAHSGSHTLALMTMARFLMGVMQEFDEKIDTPLNIESGINRFIELLPKRIVEGERGFLMSAMNSGSNLGTLLAGGMGSLMLDQYGWESMFYSIGFMAGLWALSVWLCLLKGSEAAHKRMETSNDPQWSLSRTRWLSLLKKPPVWAMVFTHMCGSCTFYTLLSWLPTYFEETFPHALGSVYNVVPWLVAIPSALIGGYMSDFIIKKGCGVLLVRKTMQFLSMGVSSMFIISLSGAVTFRSAVIFVSASIGLSTFGTSGVGVNVQDLTPSCAGALYGFMNMMGAFMGLVMVSVSGYLIEVTQSWTTVFSLITLVNTTGLGVFLIFGDARRIDLEDYKQGVI